MIHLSDIELKIIQDIIRKYIPESTVVVFGSRITHKVKPFSDLDLCIMGEDRIPENVLLDIKESFSESDLPFRVDLLTWFNLSDEFRTVIERQHEDIYTIINAQK